MSYSGIVKSESSLKIGIYVPPSVVQLTDNSHTDQLSSIINNSAQSNEFHIPDADVNINQS